MGSLFSAIQCVFALIAFLIIGKIVCKKTNGK